MKLRDLLLVAGALVLLAVPVRAQFAPGSPDDPDTPLDARTRAAVVESLAVAVRDRYIFAEKGADLARQLRRRAAQKQYDAIQSSKEFADTLTAHMQATTHDLHMRVHYRYAPLAAGPSDEDRPAPEEMERQLRFERLRNFGFEQVRRLPGNVGYLDLRQFSGAPDAQATAVAAMNFLGNCDALIVDLRRNGGGAPDMIQTLLSYLVEPGRRLNFNNFHEREGDRWVQWHTSPYVPGPRLAGKPVFVLTSPLTGSAAEEFSYDIQTHKLGTLVGGTTAGAANPGGFVRLSDHLAAFVATGRAVNPITNTNWEGVGVKPEVDVPPATALREAHVRAIEALQKNPRDDEHKAMLGRALDAAKQTPSDREADFVRPSRRRAG
jgi:retinol-binding protein 3